MANAPRLNLLDRALKEIAPGLAARRLASRMTVERLELSRRDYDGATQGRLTSDWRARNLSANSEIEVAGPILRARARDLVRNNPIAANGVQVLVSNLVGTGIRPRAKTNSARRNARLDALWAEFCARCDFYGHTDFHGLTALAVRQMVEGGDSLILQRMLPKAGLSVPLQLEVKEADHLDEAKIETAKPGGVRISQGIEYDSDGRRVAYWLHPEHPGDATRNLRQAYQSVRVPADQVVHLFERQRTQDRGVTWLSPILKAAREMDDWQLAELVRKKTEACMVGMVLGDEDDGSLAPKVTLADGSQAQNFAPGMIGYTSGARDVKFNQPAATGGVREWHSTHLHIMAAGLRVPYCLLTGDLSKANFSSSRVGLNEFRRFIEMTQWGLIIPRFCQPVWDWFVQAAYLAGKIDVETAAVEWAPPRFESVNPKQDAEADLIEVRAGFASTPQMIARRGYDPAEVIREQQEYLRQIGAAGITVESDPSKMTAAGQAQASAAGQQDSGAAQQDGAASPDAAQN